ncbi:MAG: polysaccharide pyruvyl transferase family protein [Kiritimatiellia bacterium]
MDASRTYFLVNDTRFDNHFGGLSVIRNLAAGLSARGWHCTGSLPVSACASHLRHQRRAVRAARYVVVNGEGSLHHNSRNTQRILGICQSLAPTHKLVLLNAVWQDNDPVVWRPLLETFAVIYTRDRRSQEQLRSMGIDAQYAPDLTFYDYPTFPDLPRKGYLCTDSVLSAWTDAALLLRKNTREIDVIPLFTKSLRYRRGSKDWHKVFKYQLYPLLDRRLGVRVPPRYRSLAYAMDDISVLLQKIASCQAICTARYHALCFALQQGVPFVAVASNSHKSESLLEEVGLVPGQHMIEQGDIANLAAKLRGAEDGYASIAPDIVAFSQMAKVRLEKMFDDVAGIA